MDIFRVSFIGHRVVDEYRQVEEELDEVIELLHCDIFYGHCDCFSIATEVRCDVAQNERRYYQGEYSGFQFCQWERWIDLRNRDGVIPVIFLNWWAKYCGEQ